MFDLNKRKETIERWSKIKIQSQRSLLVYNYGDKHLKSHFIYLFNNDKNIATLGKLTEHTLG